MTTITKRFLILISCVLAAIGVAFLIEVLFSFQSGWQFGHTQIGHVVGWVGFAVILTVFVYSVKKRYGGKAGWPKGWFLVHQVAGIVGPILIVIHAGPHFHALVPTLALLAMGVVTVSGLIGVAVHRKAISLLNAQRKELISQGLSQEDIEDRLFDLASDEETFRIWQIIHVPMVMIFLVLVITHVLGALYLGGL
ncbi:hypothetical protein [Methylomonas sp. HYX-M1]|uniref:hypothetical protein n=1 Tax=Methylomonas sp. HYX-M1 TaxID=3139307 RepID=UPI00345C4D06